MTTIQEYELLIVPQNEMISLIDKNRMVYNLLVTQRDKYLVHLSEKFYNMPIRQIIRDEKKYFMSIDRQAKLFYIICMEDKIPVGLCKLIDFGNDIKNIDFFQPLLQKYKLKHSIYIYGVYVLESARGKGICHSILKYVVAYIRENNITLAIADIKKNNSSSINCFTKTGFIKTNIVSRYPDVYFFTFSV